MRKFLFLEYNKPGMEWLDKEESPRIVVVDAATPEAALEEWIAYDSRYCNEEHVRDQIGHLQDNDDLPGQITIASMKDDWGVDIRMFEIKGEMSDLPWAWMTKVAVEATQPETGEIED